MSLFTTGADIKKLRHSKGMSQEALCSGLCTVSTLSKIERGAMRPSWPVFKAFMERLGEEPRMYQSDVIPRLAYYLSDLNDRLEILLLKNDEQSNMEAEKLILRNENDPFYNDKNSFFYDNLIKKHKAALYLNKREYEAAYNCAVETLKSFYDDFSEENISKFYYSDIEIDLLNILATSQFYTDSPEKSTETYTQILASFNNCQKSDKHSRRLQIKILYNISKNYGLLKEYEKCISACDGGIELCHIVYDLYFLPRFLFNKGCALLYLGQIEQGKLIMAKALTAFCVSEVDDDISMMETLLKDKFNVTLSELKNIINSQIQNV